MGKLDIGHLKKLFTKKNILNAGLILVIILSAIQIFKLVTAAKEQFENAYPLAQPLESFDEDDEEEFEEDDDEEFEEDDDEGFEEDEEFEEEEDEGFEEEDDDEGFEEEDDDEGFEAEAAEQFGSWGDGSVIEGFHDESYTPLLMEPASGSNANAMFSAPTL